MKHVREDGTAIQEGLYGNFHNMIFLFLLEYGIIKKNV